MPIALYAEKAGNVDDADADPENEIQRLIIDQVGGGTPPTNFDLILTNPNAQEYDTVRIAHTPLQYIEILNIRPSPVDPIGWADLSILPPDEDPAWTVPVDADPRNELQQLIKLGNIIELDRNGGIVILNDDDPTNELQQFDLVELGQESVLHIYDAEGNWMDSHIFYDTDPYNEIQALNLEYEQTDDGIQGLLHIDSAEVSTYAGPGHVLPDLDWTNELQSLYSEGITPSGFSPVGWNHLALERDSQTVAVDAHPENELQLLYYDEYTRTLAITDGNEVVLPPPATDLDSDPENEIQEIYKTGTSIGITSGGTVVLNDDDPTNEIQYFYKVGHTLTLEPGGSVELEDDDPGNELQSLTYNPATGELGIEGGNTVILDSSNSLPQSLSFNTNTGQLSISQGNTVDLSSIGSLWIEDTFTDPYTATYFGNASAFSFQAGESFLGQDGLRLYQPWGGQTYSVLSKSPVSGGTAGYLGLYKDSSVRVFANGGDWGEMKTFGGPNNRLNTYAGSLFGFPSNGYFSVNGPNSEERAGLFVDSANNGVVYADVKNFRMPHPEQEGKEIWYACIEGQRLPLTSGAQRSWWMERPLFLSLSISSKWPTRKA